MQIYMVKVGDYMKLIAERFQIPLYALLRANPQIPDKNKIYPGQVINIPDKIGPPMRPKPTWNPPDLSVLAIPIAPSLDPVADRAVIQKVFLRYREGSVPPGERTEWDSWMPWKRIRSTDGVVMRLPGDDEGTPFRRDGGTNELQFGLFDLARDGPAPPVSFTSIMDTVVSRHMLMQWRVIEYRFSKQDPAQGPPFTPPATTEQVILKYAGGSDEDPPDGD